MSKRLALTFAALISFALNSLLCRAALGEGLIDATSFTLVRLVSGAIALALAARLTRASNDPKAAISRAGVAASVIALFFYALPFSLAYRGLSAGTGAFVVFACVQVTMLGADLISGGRLHLREIAGLSVAVLGLFFLTRPGFDSPDPVSVLMMAVAGFSWGVYSLLGRTAGSPLPTTARNFALALPLALGASLLDHPGAYATAQGILLATVSGALTSGMGYVAWYAALPLLRKSHAAIVQLSVPPLAAVLGVILLGETVTSRLLIAAPLILFGIALAVLGRGPVRTPPPVVAGRG